MEPSPAFTVWITGLPTSGKRTLAEHVAARLRARGQQVEVIDSGKLRRGPLGATLGFSRDDRETNVLRHALAAQLLVRNGVAAVVSAVSPYRATRQRIRKQLGRFVEVHVATPKETCIEWDSSGIWKRALQGEIRNFTGVDDPYEPPEDPEVRLDLSEVPIGPATGTVIAALEAAGYLNGAPGGAGVTESEDGALVGDRLQELGYAE